MLLYFEGRRLLLYMPLQGVHDLTSPTATTVHPPPPTHNGDTWGKQPDPHLKSVAGAPAGRVAICEGSEAGSGTQAAIVALGIGTLAALEQLVGATAGGGEV